ncbi:MAG: hypothetical protein R2764_07260 [Bacteroidales bacterium]
MANLIVSTTNNNEPMNVAVNLAAKQFMTGQKKITEGMMNAVEVAIRAYDPCLGALHMPWGRCHWKLCWLTKTVKSLTAKDDNDSVRL